MFVVIVALILDFQFGEPKRYHPLVGFGHLANGLEKRFNTHANKLRSIVVGGFANICLVSPFIAIYLLAHYFLSHITVLFFLIDALVLYWAIGYRSLVEHVERVKDSLHANDITQAKSDLSMIVSRETAQLNEVQITQAAIETTLENGNDAIFGVIFWFCVFGTPAVILYRLCNTLDAMWGYRNQRFNHFGRFTARLDDVMNYIPARLVAMSYALLGNTKQALHSWSTQARSLSSPNAGPVMCAGAGSLNIRLGGPAYYHGQWKEKIFFGTHTVPVTNDIQRALNLIFHTIVLWSCFIFFFYGVSLIL